MFPLKCELQGESHSAGVVTNPLLVAAPPPVFLHPRFRALALFGRRPNERVESLVIAGVRKPAQNLT